VVGVALYFVLDKFKQRTWAEASGQWPVKFGASVTSVTRVDTAEAPLKITINLKAPVHSTLRLWPTNLGRGLTGH